MAMSSRVAAFFFSSLKSAHMVHGNWGFAPDPIDGDSTDPHGWFKGSVREKGGEKWERDEGMKGNGKHYHNVTIFAATGRIFWAVICV